MRQRTLIIGGDSKIAACLISLFRKKKEGYILTTRRKNKIKRNSIFLDLLKVKKFIIPKNIQTAIILAGIDGEKNCENQFINAKKINYFSLPFLIKKLIKKKIFVIYISSMSIYNRSSLHGNLRLLAEQKILDRLSASEKNLFQ